MNILTENIDEEEFIEEYDEDDPRNQYGGGIGNRMRREGFLPAPEPEFEPPMEVGYVEKQPDQTQTFKQVGLAAIAFFTGAAVLLAGLALFKWLAPKPEVKEETTTPITVAQPPKPKKVSTTKTVYVDASKLTKEQMEDDKALQDKATKIVETTEEEKDDAVQTGKPDEETDKKK